MTLPHGFLAAGVVMLVVGVAVQFGLAYAIIVAGVSAVVAGWAVDFDDEGDNPT